MLPAVASPVGSAAGCSATPSRCGSCTLVLVPVAGLGRIYAVTAVVLGAVFVGGCLGLRREPTARRSMRLFAFSITYVTLLFGAIAVDVLVRSGW